MLLRLLHQSTGRLRGTATVWLCAFALGAGALARPSAQAPAPAPAPAEAAAPAKAAWIARSDANAQVLIDVLAAAGPEGGGQLGVDGLDEKITDLLPGFNERTNAAVRKASATLKERLASEKEPHVRQDLEILIQSADDGVRSAELNEKLALTVPNVTQLVFGGLRALLDDQVPAERRAAALVRLRKYVGADPGMTPMTVLAQQYVKERLKQPGLLPPVKAQLERDLGNTTFFIDGIGKLFEQYHVEGYAEPFAKLKGQLTAYDAFIRSEVLPGARTDFKLPAELYVDALHQVGVDLTPDDLAARAHAAFDSIQKEMQTIAPQIAKAKGWTATDYRDVIRELKKDQLIGDAILPHYQQRLGQIEEIIRREQLVTLPARAARIRIASPAESAQTPAPNMRPPRLIGNTGEQGEFVLPLNVPTSNAGAMETFDDFTFAAASWTLTSHEARPGHELQFAAMIEAGVSTARAVFAFNSTNVEGWGLYAEAIMKPFMPPEGQLISLQHRLMRAARAFLDPELQTGKITREQAFKVLEDDVVLSKAMATQEVERYTFRSPGQATSYFYGYTRLNELRAETEKAMGSRFNQKQFHDFLLAQGLLPPELLVKAVREEFVKTH